MKRLQAIAIILIAIFGICLAAWLFSPPKDRRLWNAVEQGNAKLLRDQLGLDSFGINTYRMMTSEENGGQTLLHKACEKPEPDVVQVLLEYGANPNVQDNLGRTPLMYVIAEAPTPERLDCLNYLLKSRADLAVQDNSCQDVLYHAVAAGSRVEYVMALVSAGAPLQQPTKNSGWTPLHSASARDGDRGLEIVRILLKAGADSSIKDLSGRTPLDLARIKKNVRVAALLQENEGQ